MKDFKVVIELKQRIAALYSLLSERFPEFPKARETWRKLAEGESFQCEILQRWGEELGLGEEDSGLESSVSELSGLEKLARLPQLHLEDAYQISLDTSSLQLDAMRYLLEQVEFPQSIEVKNLSAVMAANLLELYDMMEKSMSALRVHGAVARTRVRLMALNLLFLEFDIRNYLTGIMGMSRMLSDEFRGEEGRKLLEATYEHCGTVRDAMKRLEEIRLRLNQPRD